MKIAIVCPYNFFIPGGVQEHVRAEAKELQRRGHEVAILTPRPRTSRQQPPQGVYFLGQSARLRAPSSTSADASNASSDDIDAFLRTHSFDILHVHEPEVPFMPRQIISKASCPVVGTFHAAPPENVVGKSFVTSLRPYVRSVAKLVDAITVVSRAAVEIVGAEDFDYTTISNGIDLSYYRPQSDIKRDSRSILFIGRLEKRKGLRYLLEAYEQLRTQHDDITLHIAGDGPLRDSMESYIRDNDIPDVTFHGFVDTDTKRELLSRCSVFTSPALYGESFGIVLLEAMAMGAPVIAGNNPGYRSVLSGRGSLSLVNPLDIDDFANKLHLFLTDDALRRIWLDWAAAEVKQYDWKRIVDQYETLFEGIINR